MQLFAALKQIRDFERLHLPFLKAFIDFDILIEVGYAQEEGRPLTPKQLFLMNLGSLTTVRRRLVRLVEQGIVQRRQNRSDRRSAVLSLSPRSRKLLDRYGAVLIAACTAN